MQITTGTYQGSDGFVMAYAVLSVQAPSHPNFAKIKFGFKRSSETEYTVLTGQSYSGLGWRVRIDGLIPATVYNFVAYSENAHGLLSESGNPTLTETMPGGDQLPDWIATKTYVDDEIDTLESYVDTQDAGLQSNIDTLEAYVDTQDAGLQSNIDTLESYVDAQDAGLQSNIDAVGFPAPTELTIASGVITVSGSSKFRFHSVDTENDDATDDLDTVSGGNAGEILILQAADAARDVVCKDGTNLKLAGDFTMDHTEDKIVLICISAGVWHELTRSGNGI